MAQRRLRERVHFQQRTDDGDGPFVTQSTVAAGFRPLRGGEDVMASRLSGVQPYIVTVRQSSQTRAVKVDTDWRMVDARDEAREFNIRAINDPDGLRQWFEILVQEGVAT